MIMVVILFVAASCGPRGSTVDITSPAYDDSEVTKRLDDLERRVKLLEQVEAAQDVLISALTQNVEENEDNITYLLDIASNLQDQLNSDYQSLQQSLSDISDSVTLLQTATEKGIAELIDPCGDGAGYDEVIMLLNDGSYVAYFETGSKRFLSVLEQSVNYQTTDAQRCRFKINALNELEEL